MCSVRMCETIMFVVSVSQYGYINASLNSLFITWNKQEMDTKANWNIATEIKRVNIVFCSS